MFFFISTIPSWGISEYFTTINLKLHGPSFAGRGEHHVSSKRLPPLEPPINKWPFVSQSVTQWPLYFKFRSIQRTVWLNCVIQRHMFSGFFFSFISFISYCKCERELKSVFILHSSINTKHAVSFACYNVSSHVRDCSLTLIRGPDANIFDPCKGGTWIKLPQIFQLTHNFQGKKGGPQFFEV